jgi:hypothetical protein
MNLEGSEKVFNRDCILDILWNIFDQELPKDVDVIFANQAGERPESAYITLNISSGPIMIGMDDERDTESGGKRFRETVGQREFTLSLNAYKKGANNLASWIQSKIQSVGFLEKLSELCKEKNISLCFIDSPTIQDLTSLLQSNYEERALLDIRMRSTSSYSEEIGFITSVKNEGTIKDVAGTIVDQGEVIIGGI